MLTPRTSTSCSLTTPKRVARAEALEVLPEAQRGRQAVQEMPKARHPHLAVLDFR